MLKTILEQSAEQWAFGAKRAAHWCGMSSPEAAILGSESGTTNYYRTEVFWRWMAFRESCRRLPETITWFPPSNLFRRVISDASAQLHFRKTPLSFG